MIFAIKNVIKNTDMIEKVSKQTLGYKCQQENSETVSFSELF